MTLTYHYPITSDLDKEGERKACDHRGRPLEEPVKSDMCNQYPRTNSGTGKTNAGRLDNEDDV